MAIVGVTGGFASGKTYVARLLKKEGAVVLDADVIAHRLIAPNGRCYKAVIKKFGPSILKGKQIDRRRLADVVFKNKKKLRLLEKILHPQVKQEILSTIRKTKKGGKNIFVIDVPLLFEAKWDRWVDYSIVVTADQSTQIKRARQRVQLSKQQVLERINAQMPLKIKASLADAVIDNNGSLNQTKKQVKKVWQNLLQKTKKKR